MTTYNHINAATSPAVSWESLIGSGYTLIDSTLLLIINANSPSTRTFVYGSGFALDPVTEELVGGTITSIVHTSGFGLTTYETATGFSVEAVDFFNAMTASQRFALMFSGNDTFTGYSGNDTFNGYAGTDLASYSSAATGITLTLGADNSGTATGAGTDTLSSIENVNGSAFNDSFQVGGATGDNAFDGNAGIDSVSYATAAGAIVMTMMAVLKTYDERLDQAAASLGASPWRTLTKITFPLLRGGMIASFLFAFITSFDELTISLFVSGGLVSTLPRQMWNDMLLQVNPTLAAVSTTMLVVITAIILGAEYMRRRATKA